MKQEEKDFIEKNVSELAKCTRFYKSVLSKLGFLSEQEIDELELLYERGRISQAHEVYRIAKMRSEAYTKLIEVLESEKQDEAVKILKRGIACQNNSLTTSSCDSVDSNVLALYHSQIGKPLKVVMQLSQQTTPPFLKDKGDYKLSSMGKGQALLINIKEFDGPNALEDERDGSEFDLDYMRNVWRQLGYNIYKEKYIDNKHQKWYKNDLKAIIEEFRQFCNNPKNAVNSIVVFIGSHGELNTIYTSDSSDQATQQSFWAKIWKKSSENRNNTIDLQEDIIQNFYHGDQKCPGLKGKPKIFIVSACQGNPIKKDTLDPKLEVPVSDLVVCTPQAPGHPSYRIQSGTLLIHCLTWVMMNFSHEKSFNEMLEMTTEILKSTKKKDFPDLEYGQIPSVTSIGFKRLYFFS